MGCTLFQNIFSSSVYLAELYFHLQTKYKEQHVVCLLCDEHDSKIGKGSASYSEVQGKRTCTLKGVLPEPGPSSVCIGMGGMVKQPCLQSLVYLRTIQLYTVCLDHYVSKQKLMCGPMR